MRRLAGGRFPVLHLLTRSWLYVSQKLHEPLRNYKRKAGKGVAGWEKCGLGGHKRYIYHRALQKDCLAAETAQPVKCELGKHGECASMVGKHGEQAWWASMESKHGEMGKHGRQAWRDGQAWQASMENCIYLILRTHIKWWVWQYVFVVSGEVDLGLCGQLA